MKKVLILALIALCLVVPSSASRIEYNMTISEPGTYTLSEDMLIPGYQHGILIKSSNVVLDGQNHQLMGNNSEMYPYGIEVYTIGENKVENVTIKNLTIKDCYEAVFIVDARNVTVINCEFENNTYFLESLAPEIYFYLNKIHEGQSAKFYSAPLASPKLSYNYNGSEYTYRLGNYYEGYVGTEKENEGVYKGLYGVLDGESVSAYEIYPLIETPENYEVLEIIYPEIERVSPSSEGIILDIFALKSSSKNYIITDEVPSEDDDSSSGSSGSSGGSSYARDLSGGITSTVIKHVISNSNVVYGSEIDEGFAEQLRENLQNGNNYELSEDTIIVGGPNANGLANSYNGEFEVPISNNYPGENRGIIQVQNIEVHVGNFIKTYQVIYIAGSDRFGTQAALEYFKTLDELPEGPITVEWTAKGPVLVE
ncbi:NosD domain-containing protein [Methanococcus maripaludis]|uniref:Periplasmic copper-binding protein NosD beta helix domain-containing protein n=2 Tax=Methanococcus maripaludis TaxID=39152 RepID=A0A7J9PG34_METMI|nr:hypothetical protein [Methanococcus maripaludis]MBA2861754.1 hypothetical protein [Methanococcus maripaludis]